MPQAQGKRGKAPDERPARKRYWSSRALQTHKVAALMKQDPSKTEAEALRAWKEARGNRRTPWTV